MNILALDLATKTGFAHTDGTSGVWTLPQCEHNGARWNAFFGWLDRLLDAHPADAVVWEMAHHRGGATTRFANALVAETERVAHIHGARVKSYHSATIKKHATGSGRADKCAMAIAAKARNPTVKLLDDNHVDALWLLDLALNDREL